MPRPQPNAAADLTHNHASGGGTPVRLEILLAALVIVIAAFMLIGYRGLWEPDEGRYTAVAMEMVRTGDWLHPQLNHEHPHYTKPPMTYWWLAASISAFGRSEWALRLPGAVAFGMTALMVGLIARRLSPGRGVIAAVLYATSAMPFLASNIVTTDTLLAMFESVGMLGLVYAWLGTNSERRDAGNLRWILLMWAGFGLAFMTKGPPALLPLGAGVIAALLTRERRVVLRLFHPLGLFVFAVVGGAWYVAVIVDQPDLLRYFLFDEVYARVATGKHGRNPEWYMAFMFPLLLIGGMLPWSFDWFRRTVWGRGRNLTRSRLDDPGTMLLGAWIVIPLLIFMASSSRLPLYILPIMAPLAVLTARVQPPDWLRMRSAWASVLTTLCVLLVLRIGLGTFSSAKDDRLATVGVVVLPEIHEIVYVDKRARLGFSFYYDREVEEVSLASSADGGKQSLDEELEELEGTLLLVADELNRDRVRAVLDRHGWSVVRCDSLDDDLYMVVTPPPQAVH